MHRGFVLLCVVLLAAGCARVVTVNVAQVENLRDIIAQSKPGDTIHLPAGRYTITEAITPKAGTRIIGDGQEKTFIRYGGEKPGVLIALNNCEEVEVAHLTLDGENNPNVYQGISGGNARRLKVHHVTIRNLVKSKTFGPHGILFSGKNPTRENGVTDSEVSDCLIENIAPDAQFGCGIRFAWGSSRNKVLRNVIRNTGRGGIFGDNGSTDLVIQGNTVSGSGGEGLGIEVWGGCDRAVIEDNHIDHWLSIGGSDFCAVRRNVISDKSGVFKGYGIEAIGSHLVITGNLVDDGQHIGASVSAQCPKDYVFWGRNAFLNCIQWGAQLQGETTGAAHHYVYRCKFNNTSADRGAPRYPKDRGHGFRTNGNIKHLVLEECEFSDNGRFGVQLGGGGVDFLSFVRCAIQNNKGAAVVGPRDYSALEWKDCTVKGNADNKLPPEKPFPQAPPTSSFDAPEAARVGEPVSFSDTSRPAQGKIAAVLWDFGDGVPATDPRTSHAYARPGEYLITLVAWDDSGRGARCEKRIAINH